MAAGPANASPQAAGQPTERSQPAEPAQPVALEQPAGHTGTGSWPVIVAPLAVITLAAVAGNYADDAQFTLVVGAAGAALVCGVAAHRLLGRRERWKVAVVISAVALLLMTVGLVWLRTTDPGDARAEAPSSVTPSQTARQQSQVAPSSWTYAGRTFTQQDIAAISSFRGADLRGAQLVGLDLRRLDFSGADAAGASFESSQLESAVFRGTDLGGANLRQSCLHLADLIGADLTGVDATGADVAEIQLSDQALSGAESWPTGDTVSTACQ